MSVIRPVAFSYRSARSGSVLAGFGAAIVIETVALHLALVSRHPFLAWSLTTLNVLTIAWLIRDYVALGRHVIHVDDESLYLNVGRRFDISVSLSNIARALRPSFRDLPRSGTNQGRDYLDLTTPASPNVLLVLNSVVKVRLPGGFHRMIGRFGLHLDEPDAFLTEVATRQTRIVAANVPGAH
jgi:hypothetical protein